VLRGELQAEHAQLMRAMSAQNDNMALLQHRAEVGGHLTLYART